MIYSVRIKQYTNFLLLAVYFVILCLAYKNYGFFVVISVPLVINYLLSKKLNPVLNNEKQHSKAIASGQYYCRKYKRLLVAVITIALLIIITSITGGYPIFRQSPYRFGFGFDNDQLPVEATLFLQKNKMKGKILNHLDFGGYLMANDTDEVFIDGRMELLDENFFTKYFESLTSRNGILPLLKEHDPDIVIFPYLKASGWWEYFITHKKLGL